VSLASGRLARTCRHLQPLCTLRNSFGKTSFTKLLCVLERQIPHIIHLLTEGSPADQRDALHAYFLPDAAFIHPLCRVPTFSNISLPLIGGINSRWVIWMIYRWYKILSPRILLEVECDGRFSSTSTYNFANLLREYNQKSQILFVEINQIFSLFFIPFYKSNVHLTTKIHLVQLGNGKYYIQSQEDLYQLNEVVKFFWPGGATIIWLWQIFATILCILGALILAPMTWMEQRHANQVSVSKKKVLNG
jgi:hypothetical protein